MADYGTHLFKSEIKLQKVKRNMIKNRTEVGSKHIYEFIFIYQSAKLTILTFIFNEKMRLDILIWAVHRIPEPFVHLVLVKVQEDCSISDGWGTKTTLY